jgi:hypothetical protein
MLDSGPGPGRAGRARHKGLGWPYLSVTQMRPAHERERSGRLPIKLQEGRPVSGYMPSVDALFQSAAKLAGAKGLFAMAQAGAIPLPRTRRPASSSVCRARQSRSAPQRLAAIGPANAGFSRAFLKLANLLCVDCHETAVEHIGMETLQARFRLEQSASDARL